MTDLIAVDSDGHAELVDQPDVLEAPERVAGVIAERREPIVVDWARSLDGWKSWASWHAQHHAHVAAFHTARTPLYTARAAGRLPRGAGRATVAACRWVADTEGRPVRMSVVESRDPVEYRKLVDQHDDRVRRRVALAATGALAAAAAAVWVWLANPEVQILAGLLAFAGLSKLGEQRDRPIVSRAVVATKVEQLTENVCTRALVAALPGKVDPLTIKYPDPIKRDGRGWLAVVDLPHDVTATKVMENRDGLAAALRRPLGAVWPETRPDVHPGRLHVWVGDEDMGNRKPVKWPLATKGTVDLFDSFPFGQDQRGRAVTICLMFASMVVGAVPRVGKTFAVRLLALAAALDVRAQLHLYDLKGTGDFSALERVAHRYRAGDDDDDIDYALADMRDLRTEMRRRAKVIAGLPRSQCPENKVTSELASRRPLGLHPVFVAVDECHLWFQHDRHGAEFEQIVADLSKRGPAMAIFVVCATQEPNKDSLPTSISRNAVLRFCLKVMDQIANDAVLGTSAYRRGLRATLLSRKDLGVGLLAGEGDEPQIVRTYYVDNPTAEAIAERARALREAGGWLTGDADDDPLTPVDTDNSRLLVDILSVVPADEDTVWSETVCARLATHRPSDYGRWAATDDVEHNRAVRTALASRLKTSGIVTRQVFRTIDGEGYNRRGFDRSDVVDALRDVQGAVSEVA